MTSSLHQPIHTVYGGAHLFKSTTCGKLGALAERAFVEHAPNAGTLAQVFGIPEALTETVHARVAEKLRREPVEDFRIDFEDGFGYRPDDEEDAATDNAAREVTEAVQAGSLPGLFGIRIKSFSSEKTKARALRTLNRFLSRATLPENFVVTLPKITAHEQVAGLVDALRAYPQVRIEIMVETPESIFMLPRLLEAARGKCLAAHFGAYDYTASLGITAANQDLHHPACDFGRSMMLASLAGTGVWLVDGATNLIPIPPAVHQAWKLHYDNIRHSLYNGFYQGWDLHPAQIPARLVAVHTFFLEGLEEASARLRNFMDRAAQATRVGAVFDDAATGRGLLNYFERAVHCGAVDKKDIPGLTGVTVEELGSSFDRILAARRSVQP
ncbi:MAG: phosphoenolpyruvate kinase [Acidobacteriia bacterium]|nr:phosphoenolpyruvate kinase [Terriglobia bacterium]